MGSMSGRCWAEEPVAEEEETAAAPVLPQAGDTVKLLVAEVGVREGQLLLWGRWGSLRSPRAQQGLYTQLHQRMQAAPGPRMAGHDTLREDDGCLKEVAGCWLRGRVVRQPSCGRDNYWVFLLDTGCTVIANPAELARGHKAYFRLPAEVLVCTVAGLRPWKGGRWSRDATEFLLGLQGQELSGLVREVLHPFCVVVLEVPALVAQMQQQGFSRPTTPATFRTFLYRHLSTAPEEGEAAAPSSTSSLDTEDPMKLNDVFPLMDFNYPKLDLNATKWVLVTEIHGPHRIYCQLRSFSREMQYLSSAMSQASEGNSGEDLQREAFLPILGSPCAAQGKDGHWYRALVLEIYPEGSLGEHPGTVAQVVCVDSGRKEFVSRSRLRPLPAECLSVPVVTYPCALRAVMAKDRKWTPSQISKLKPLLLGKVVQVHIEAYCAFENVYYVTFLGVEGFRVNCLFGERPPCLTQRCVHSRPQHTSDLGAGENC